MELLIISLFGMSCTSIIGFLIGKSSKDETVIFEYPPQSELSDPSINCTPVGFGRPHIQILEVIKANDPHEVTRKQINLALGKSKKPIKITLTFSESDKERDEVLDKQILKTVFGR